MGKQVGGMEGRENEWGERKGRQEGGKGGVRKRVREGGNEGGRGR